MTSTIDTPQPDLKARHRAMWALGDYPSVASEVIANLGQRLVDACEIGPDDRVLDVATGSGNAALPAARRGARVTASDLTPELLTAGARAAEEEGLELRWEEADAESLPYDDASFDVAMSCVGVMFAPFHRAAADELVRVTRSGGRIGLVSWTPEGFIGQMLGVMRPFAPAPPAGAQPPPLWGDEEHVRDLLAARVDGLRASRERLPVDRFDTAEAFRDFFKAAYGPTIAVYRAIADEPDRVAELDAALTDLARSSDLGGGAMEWEYLLVTARRA